MLDNRMCFLHLSFPSPVLKAGFLSVSYCLSSTKIKQGTVCSLSAGTITRSWNTLLGHHFLLFRQKFMESLKSSLLGKLIAGFFLIEGSGYTSSCIHEFKRQNIGFKRILPCIFFMGLNFMYIYLMYIIMYIMAVWPFKPDLGLSVSFPVCTNISRFWLFWLFYVFNFGSHFRSMNHHNEIWGWGAV